MFLHINLAQFFECMYSICTWKRTLKGFQQSQIMTSVFYILFLFFSPPTSCGAPSVHFMTFHDTSHCHKQAKEADNLENEKKSNDIK